MNPIRKALASVLLAPLVLAACEALDAPRSPRADREPAPSSPSPAPAAPSAPDALPPSPGPTEPAAPTGPARYLAIVIHGTALGPDGGGAAPDDDLGWMEAGEKGTFSNRLRARLRERVGDDADVKVQQWRWQGWADHDARFHAALQLARHLDGIDADTAVFLVGHSHGGNVALLAAGLAQRKPAGVATLGTPFLVATLRNNKSGKEWRFPVYTPPPPDLLGVELVCVYSPEDQAAQAGAAGRHVEASVERGDLKRTTLPGWREFHGIGEDLPKKVKGGGSRFSWEFPELDTVDRQTLKRSLWRTARNVSLRWKDGPDASGAVQKALHGPRIGAALADWMAGSDAEAAFDRRGLDLLE